MLVLHISGHGGFMCKKMKSFTFLSANSKFKFHRLALSFITISCKNGFDNQKVTVLLGI